MKKHVMIFAYLTCFACFAQAQEWRNNVPDTISNNRLYPVDTLGANQQVRNDTSYLSGQNRVPTDSTRTRFGEGGKSSKDMAHTKKYPARKDTTHIKSSTRKTKTYSRQSVSTKSKE